MKIVTKVKIPGAKLQEKYAAGKVPALRLLRKKYSAGAIARNLELPYNLVVFWREIAGIAPLPKGFRRPTPAVGERLK